jgi:DNA-binding transcriptional MerR regulator
VARTEGPASYTIAAVSKLTGVSCHTLRVWERRYGFPVPRRSPSGHRRYREEDVRKLHDISAWLRRGESIGEVIARMQAGTLPGPSAAPGESPPAACWLARLYEGDLTEAEEQFEREAARLSPADQASLLIGPALVEVGECWFRGECQVSQERCASTFLRRKLDILLEQAQKRNERPTRKALVGTVQGDRHEGGVLIAALLLELAGCRALTMGGDLPIGEYQKAIDLWRPDFVAISLVLSRNIRKRFEELAQLRGAKVYIGGRSILNYRGLARRLGLVPVVGPATEAVRRMLTLVDVASHQGGAR